MPVLEIAIVVSGIAALVHHSGGSFQGLVQAAKALFTAVQQVEENQKSWAFLASRSRDILFTLSRSRTDARGFAEQADRLTVFFNTILEFHFNEVQSLHKVQRVFKSDKIRRQIEQYCHELESLWQNVVLALAIDSNNRLNEAELRHALRQDEDLAETQINELVAMMQQNHSLVMQRLDILVSGQQDWQQRQAVTALQKLRDDSSTNAVLKDRTIVPLLESLQDASPVAKSVQVEDWRIFPESITNWSAKPICSGGFGDVYTATYFGTRVAVKQLRCSCLEQEIGEFRSEIRVWHQLSHNHILPLRGACDTVEKLFMVSPFMENGTLKSYLGGPVRRPPGREAPLDERSRFGHGVSPQQEHHPCRPQIVECAHWTKL